VVARQTIKSNQLSPALTADPTTYWSMECSAFCYPLWFLAAVILVLVCKPSLLSYVIFDCPLVFTGYMLIDSLNSCLTAMPKGDNILLHFKENNPILWYA
jgi:hypothetical protein